MICKCGQRLMRHEPTCLNCGEHNSWFETEDQGATGGVEEQIPTFRINDRAAESRDSYYTRASKGITGIHSQMAALRVNEEFKQDASVKKKHARVLYSYEPTSDEQLKLQVDDIVDDVQQINSEWSEATLNDKRGYIPSNYVEIIDEGETSDSSDDLSDFKVDSEFSQEDDIITQDEFWKYVSVLQQSGFLALMTELERTNTEWKDFKIKIAITGESGAGKSTLINALRNLKDDDNGAAQVGCVETTIEPTRYQHPNNRNLELWDLPGVGTPNFPQTTYLKKANFQQYDFIILVSSSRFTDNDNWLAKSIAGQYPTATLFFVRTKVDCDLSNIKQGKRNSMTEEDIQNTLLKIKEDCRKNLQNSEIGNPHIFMVNSHNVNAFEFGKLSGMLVEKVKSEKQAALVLSLSVLSNTVVDEKVKQLKQRINKTSKYAAMAAVNSDRENNEKKEIGILQKELVFYQCQLGIDRKSLDILAIKFKLDFEEICRQLNFRSHRILQRFEIYYGNHDKIKPSKKKFIEFLFFRTKKFQKQCGRFLEKVLNICIQENHSLHSKIAMWSTEQSDYA
ncbi:T-cell-specific guanine nucleotide triphosphate-binding protein 2-like isoform X2 [Dreissena polymorpha]|uniref:IRG-type G domain-containing protein n=1 Tax=Dreissena polymorpha TaxID=45954 RepID=A0A9D4HMU1_DREPO|nr:T-cell-specific guanine nucleotide triphosphate-binding protein 2-like isoform X2 [Dreissena polymorpha]KAH3726342.1 hypothetical protein DPMN_052204 [Dreissena polymorpha]